MNEYKNLENVMEEFEGKSISELESMFVAAYKNNDLKQLKNIVTKSDLKDNLDPQLILEGFSFARINKSVNPGIVTYIGNLAKKLFSEKNPNLLTKKRFLN